MALPEFLTKKVAGAPAGVWIVGLGGIVGFYLYTKNKSAGTTVAPATTGTGSGGTVDASGLGDYTPAGGFAGSSTDSTSSTSNTTYTDNNAWGTAAINYLVGHSYDAGTANQAITLYLASEQLTTQQQAMVNVVIGALGAPPQLVAPVNGSVPNTTGTSSNVSTYPVAPGGNGAVQYAPYTVPTNGMTNWQIIQSIYGVPLTDYVDYATLENEINNANPQVQSPYQAGQQLLVPVMTADGIDIQKSYPA
jgi:hypothetical protein